MHLAGISGHPRRISDYPTIFYRVHYIESIGTLGGVLSLIIFAFAIIGILAIAVATGLKI
jgi:heme/copper-type cytochrome/quinol oxidase subunit 1